MKSIFIISFFTLAFYGCSGSNSGSQQSSARNLSTNQSLLSEITFDKLELKTKHDFNDITPFLTGDESENKLFKNEQTKNFIKKYKGIKEDEKELQEIEKYNIEYGYVTADLLDRINHYASEQDESTSFYLNLDITLRTIFNYDNTDEQKKYKKALLHVNRMFNTLDSENTYFLYRNCEIEPYYNAMFYCGVRKTDYMDIKNTNPDPSRRKGDKKTLSNELSGHWTAFEESLKNGHYIIRINAK